MLLNTITMLCFAPRWRKCLYSLYGHWHVLVRFWKKNHHFFFLNRTRMLYCPPVTRSFSVKHSLNKSRGLLSSLFRRCNFFRLYFFRLHLKETGYSRRHTTRSEVSALISMCNRKAKNVLITRHRRVSSVDRPVLLFPAAKQCIIIGIASKQTRLS